MSAKEAAIKLRKQGYSYTHIAKETGLAVSTLSYHLSSIPYTPNEETVKRIGRARVASANTHGQKKRKTIEEAKVKAREAVGKITARDMFMLGIGLYIGEGSKTHDIVRLVNMDYRVINLYIEWLLALGMTRKNFVIRIHLYPDSDIHSAERYWMKKINMPQAQFQSASIDKRVGKDRKKNGVHKYGTAHVTVRAGGNKAFGVMLARWIGACMEEVLEYRSNKKRA